MTLTERFLLYLVPPISGGGDPLVPVFPSPAFLPSASPVFLTIRPSLMTFTSATPILDQHPGRLGIVTQCVCKVHYSTHVRGEKRDGGGEQK